MVDKFTKPPYGEKVVDKINEIIDNLGSGGITVDDELSTTSENPVQNKVITGALEDKQDKLTAGNNIVIEEVEGGLNTQTVDSYDWNSIINDGQYKVYAYTIESTYPYSTTCYETISSDGNTWSSVVTKTDGFTKVYYNNGKYIATGRYSGYDYIYTSNDGNAWTRTSVYNYYRPYSITISNNKYIGWYYDGMSHAGFVTSEDSTNWLKHDYNRYSSYFTTFNDAIYFNGNYIFVGIGSTSVGALCISSDFSNWTGTLQQAITLRSATTSSTKAVTVGDNGYVSTSTDGTTWVTPYQVGTVKWQYVTYEDKFVALGYVTDGSNYNMYSIESADGDNWSEPTLLGTVDFIPRAYIYKNGIIIASGADGKIASYRDEGLYISAINIPTATSDITNDSGFITGIDSSDVITALGYTPADESDLATVATSGSYNDLSNKPTIPTVNNATLTIQKNGTTVKTFTANASSNVTANITVPTATSDLTNDSGFITGIDSSDVTTALGYTPADESDLSTVATTGSYNDLSDKPTIPSAVTESTVSGWGFTKNTGTVTSVNNTTPVNGNVTLSIPQQVQANWNETDTTSKAYIQNKPTIPDTSTLANTSLSNLTSTGNNLVNTALNTRDNSTRLKFWTGTKAQYDAISTKDSNTLYYITDDQDITLTLLQTIYPVGSVYLSTNATCPLASLFGTWTLVSSGRALWTGTGSNGGSTIEAGLPDHHHLMSRTADITNESSGTTVKASYDTVMDFNTQNPARNFKTGTVTESESNPIYGNSTTVQPPAYVVNVWRRTA